MKLVMMTMLLVTPCLFAGEDEKKAETKPAAVAAKQAKLSEIPADAKQIEPGVYRWKDAQGKTWILRKSPFGLVKWEEKAEAAEGAEELPAGLKVTEEGDELAFERPTPFGTVHWRKKKAELNEIEQRAWQREQKKRAAEKPQN